MRSFEDVELFDCPLCHGSGLIEEENGWCAYVTCMDCGCHTAEVPYQNAEQREQAIRRVRHSDAARESYYHYLTKGKWGNLSNYHLTLNSSPIGKEACADIIMAYAAKTK